METIPKIVLDYAQNEGFNNVEFVCDDYNGFAVYAVGIVGSDGLPVPIGPPMFLLLKGDLVRYASVEESMDLCLRL